MNNRMLATVTGFVLTIGVGSAVGQPVEPPRFEVGAQVGSLRFKEFSTVLGRRNEISVGGRFTVNLNRLLAAESEVGFYPNDGFFEDRKKIQGLFGVRAGVRKERVGVFAKLRPGFVHVRDRLTVCLAQVWACQPSNDYIGRVWLAVDTGGVVEFYASRRLALRFDVADLYVRRWSHSDGTGRDYYFGSHNLQVGGSTAIRF